MDEMALLERFRSDVEVDTTSLIRSRRRVMRHALARYGVTRRRRRLVLGAAAVVAAVAVTINLTGGLAVTPATAAVLARAAAATDGGAQPGPGEYLHLHETTTRWYADGPETTIQEWWIPGDEDEPRVFRDFEGSVYLDRSPLPDIYTQPGLSDEEVLEWLRRPNGDLRGDDAAYERVGEVLVSGKAPSDFEAALFNALSSIDGVTIVDEHADFGGREVVIIGREQPMETQFAFDKQSGRLVGYQGVSNPDVGGSLSYRTITTSFVVDRLPARAEPVE